MGSVFCGVLQFSTAVHSTAKVLPFIVVDNVDPGRYIPSYTPQR
jgi:hypothetical protein